jgi:hypothetical protein
MRVTSQIATRFRLWRQEVSYQLFYNPWNSTLEIYLKNSLIIHEESTKEMNV